MVLPSCNTTTGNEDGSLDSSTYSKSYYLERFEQVFAANDVPFRTELPEELTKSQLPKQRGPQFGTVTYSLPKGLLSPVKPGTNVQSTETGIVYLSRSTETGIVYLSRHLKRKRLVLAERVRFHSEARRGRHCL